MARRNIKVTIPIGKADEFISLTNTVLKKHEELGDNSPLRILDMTTLKKQLAEAEDNRAESKILRGQSEIKLQESMNSLGLGKGQAVDTPGTAYNLLTQSRDLLLTLNKGKEEALKDFGFKVVVSEGSSGKRKKEVVK